MNNLHNILQEVLHIDKVDLVNIMSARENLLALIINEDRVEQAFKQLRGIILTSEEKYKFDILFKRYDKLDQDVRNLIKQNYPTTEAAAKGLIEVLNIEKKEVLQELSKNMKILNQEKVDKKIDLEIKNNEQQKQSGLTKEEQERIEELEAIEQVQKAKDDEMKKDVTEYNLDKIKELVGLELKKTKVLIEALNLEEKEISEDQIKELLNLFTPENKVIAVALHLKGEAYAAMILSKQDEKLKIIYNDPTGDDFSEEQNVQALIFKLTIIFNKINKGGKVTTVDLMEKQIINDKDSGAIVTETLVKLGGCTVGAKKSELIKMLPSKEEINAIKVKHILMQDDGLWYSNEKIEKILDLELEGKGIYRAPIAIMEEQELLMQIIEAAARDVMSSSQPAIVPMHVHGNHWTSLVIKKKLDNSLQLIYNDSKGDSLYNEENSGVILRAVGKVNSNIQIIDLKLKQQNNDDDCGPYVCNNLIVLANNDTFLKTTDNIQELIKSLSVNKALVIRKQHIKLLNDAGIPIEMIKDQIIKEQEMITEKPEDLDASFLDHSVNGDGLVKSLIVETLRDSEGAVLSYNIPLKGEDGWPELN